MHLKRSSQDTFSDKLDDILPLRQPEKPRSATGIALPVEMMNTEKRNGQITPSFGYWACIYAMAQVKHPVSSLMIGRAHSYKALKCSRLVIGPTRRYAFFRPETSSFPLPTSFVCCFDSVFSNEGTLGVKSSCDLLLIHLSYSSPSNHTHLRLTPIKPTT